MWACTVCGHACTHDCPEMTVPMSEPQVQTAGGGGGARWPMPVIQLLGGRGRNLQLQRLGYLRSYFKKTKTNTRGECLRFQICVFNSIVYACQILASQRHMLIRLSAIACKCQMPASQPAWHSNSSHFGEKNITKHWHLQLLKDYKERETPAKGGANVIVAAKAENRPAAAD